MAWPCLGVLRTKTVCKRGKHGNPISMRVACKRCGEMRCRAHCRCARSNKLEGRARARDVTTVQRPREAAVVESAAVAGPVGRPAHLAFEYLSVAEWWAKLLVELRSAEEVVLVSYVLDHPKLVETAARRLRTRSMSVRVLVDQEALGDKLAPHEKPRLRELQKAGADVLVCRGVARLGRLHGKAAVLDRRVAFAGSANLTAKSEANVEFCYRLAGPPVADLLEMISAVAVRGRCWDGV